MKATLLDTLTGAKHIVTGHPSVEWAEGDLAHDNARLESSDAEDDADNILFRFIVVGAEFEPDELKFSLYRLNALYPVELLKAAGIETEPCREQFCAEFDDTEPPGSLFWRHQDARDLIHPVAAQRFFSLWERTGINFLNVLAKDILEEIDAQGGKLPVTLFGIAEKVAADRLTENLNSLRDTEKWMSKAYPSPVLTHPHPHRRAKKKEAAS